MRWAVDWLYQGRQSTVDSTGRCNTGVGHLLCCIGRLNSQS